MKWNRNRRYTLYSDIYNIDITLQFKTRNVHKTNAKTFLFTTNSNNAKENLAKNTWKSLKSSIINNVLSITDRKIFKIEQELKPLPKLLHTDIVILRKASEIKNIWKTAKSYMWPEVEGTGAVAMHRHRHKNRHRYRRYTLAGGVHACQREKEKENEL